MQRGTAGDAGSPGAKGGLLGVLNHHCSVPRLRVRKQGKDKTKPHSFLVAATHLKALPSESGCRGCDGGNAGEGVRKVPSSMASFSLGRGPDPVVIPGRSPLPAPAVPCVELDATAGPQGPHASRVTPQPWTLPEQPPAPWGCSMDPKERLCFQKLWAAHGHLELFGGTLDSRQRGQPCC